MGDRLARIGAGSAGLSLALELVRVARDQGWIQHPLADPTERSARRALELCLPTRQQCVCPRGQVEPSDAAATCPAPEPPAPSASESHLPAAYGLAGSAVGAAVQWAVQACFFRRRQVRHHAGLQRGRRALLGGGVVE